MLYHVHDVLPYAQVEKTFGTTRIGNVAIKTGWKELQISIRV